MARQNDSVDSTLLTNISDTFGRTSWVVTDMGLCSVGLQVLNVWKLHGLTLANKL